MARVLRFLASLVVFAASYLVILWVPSSLIPAISGLGWVPNAMSLLAALLIAWFVWSRSKSVPGGLANTILLCTAVSGSVSLTAGFFYLILRPPDAFYGWAPFVLPLVLFFLLPGAIIGAVGGFMWWHIRERANRAA